MKIFSLSALLMMLISLSAQKDPVIKCIQNKIEGVASIEVLGDEEGFEKVYDIRLNQPVDHNNPEAGEFQQRIYLYHKDYKKPVIFVTEGYDIKDRKYELTDILDANQISVEYRFFGESAPDTLQWEYLTNKQAAEDLHRIRDMFGRIYKEEWVSTGISKGGTTTMMYKALYPGDVDASVNYVGPLPLAQEDRRMDAHILSIGDEACREKLHNFQVEALERRDDLLPKIDSLAEAENMSFSIGSGAALEFAVLEYTFSFWQYAHDCDEVPDTTASDQEIFKSLNDIVGYDFYSDATYEYYRPAFYQFMSENGYYGFIHDHVSHLLENLDYPSNLTFAPREIEITYDSTFMHYVNQTLRNVGDKMIHIHGEYDPWGAVGFFPEEDQDALLVVKLKGDHKTRIKDLDEGDKELVYNKLSEWLEAEVHPLGDVKASQP